MGIMVELSNDVHFVLPMMIAVMAAKRIADSITHGLYHSIMEVKCIPFLDTVDSISHPRHNLDLFSVDQIMTEDVKSLPTQCSVDEIAFLLDRCEHHCFAVLDKLADGRRVFAGSIA